ncbi:MAG: transcription accessory protein [Pseudomonadota bacterium]
MGILKAQGWVKSRLFKKREHRPLTSHPRITQVLAAELAARPEQVIAAVALLDEGATVPFIARYRKEVTGGLDDTQLRLLEVRLVYLRELEDRRASIMASISEQGKLTPTLAAAIAAAADKASLEDLYLPYKPKRRSKAMVAKEAGLEPLADALLSNPQLPPEIEAAKYLKPAFTTDAGENSGVPDVKAALEGARQILMERFAEHAGLIAQCRDTFAAQAQITVSLAADYVGKEKEEAVAKFSDYFDYSEAVKGIPSHRALALLRGRREGFLNVLLHLDGEDPKPRFDAPHNLCECHIAKHAGISAQGRAADKWLLDTVRFTWRIKIGMALETELLSRMREVAEAEAIRVFGMNLKDLLLAAPAGAKTTLGLDPGLRTGVKVALVDGTGKLLATDTIYPHAPRNDWQGSLMRLQHLCDTHKVALIAIGNGTASRETDQLAAELCQCMAGAGKQGVNKVVVSEAGASVYSASELAAQEFPELDVSLRGAVSIARRLQDPLAELVKIDPKSIGVGQYQHDVNQTELAARLDAVVEDCVNGVGVDLNSASVPLLTRISGLSASVAHNIVRYRDEHGAFKNRKALLQVPRLGEKAFEQSAGFLRIRGGDEPLDASAVHPEAYEVVRRMAHDAQAEVLALIGDAQKLKQIKLANYVDARVGLPTLEDIRKELEKPGRDPRPEFKTARFSDIAEMKDLRLNMTLEGVVTNVTNFGAFVDIGVHQDGLVHISALAHTFVKDPRAVVKVGDVVKVKVMEVDVARKRIALSMRLSDVAQSDTLAGVSSGGKAKGSFKAAKNTEPPLTGAFASAFAKAQTANKKS